MVRNYFNWSYQFFAKIDSIIVQVWFFPISLLIWKTGQIEIGKARETCLNNVQNRILFTFPILNSLIKGTINWDDSDFFLQTIQLMYWSPIYPLVREVVPKLTTEYCIHRYFYLWQEWSNPKLEELCCWHKTKIPCSNPHQNSTNFGKSRVIIIVILAV